MTKILFIGDITGDTGLQYLEKRIPELVAEHHLDFVVANAENMDTNTAKIGRGSCGMRVESLERLFATGVDLVTGGNHSWDGPDMERVQADPRVIRPLNFGSVAPGRGAAIVTKNGLRLGVINAASRTAISDVDHPLDVIERQVDAWAGQVDMILVDFHGGSVTEKMIIGFAFAGKVTGVVGTHTHVRTLDTQLLPGGTAYVTDVGMTGPSGGIQGYDAAKFVAETRLRLFLPEPIKLANGAVELGAVVITCEGMTATAIERILA